MIDMLLVSIGFHLLSASALPMKQLDNILSLGSPKPYVFPLPLMLSDEALVELRFPPFMPLRWQEQPGALCFHSICLFVQPILMNTLRECLQNFGQHSLGFRDEAFW